MAFKSRDLSVIAYAQGFTVWHYKTGERWQVQGTNDPKKS